MLKRLQKVTNLNKEETLSSGFYDSGSSASSSSSYKNKNNQTNLNTASLSNFLSSTSPKFTSSLAVDQYNKEVKSINKQTNMNTSKSNKIESAL